MTTFTRIACLSLVALLASTSLSAADPYSKNDLHASVVIDVDTYDPPVDVDTYDPPIDVNTPVDDDHDLTDVFDVDGHDLTDSLVDDEDKADDVAERSLLLSCKIVDGDLVITNEGDPIDAGTKLSWKALGQHGAVLLPRGLRTGQKAKIDLDLSADTGKCTVDVVL